jgi:hypothetical protein
MSPPWLAHGAYRSIPPSVTEGFMPCATGYHDHMGILILVLVILAIVALVLYIARRSRV